MQVKGGSFRASSKKTNPWNQNHHYFKGDLSKTPYIRIVWTPPKKNGSHFNDQNVLSEGTILSSTLPRWTKSATKTDTFGQLIEVHGLHPKGTILAAKRDTPLKQNSFLPGFTTVSWDNRATRSLSSFNHQDIHKLPIFARPMDVVETL